MLIEIAGQAHDMVFLAFITANRISASVYFNLYFGQHTAPWVRSDLKPVLVKTPVFNLHWNGAFK